MGKMENSNPKRRRISSLADNVQPDEVVSSPRDSYPPVVTVVSDPTSGNNECTPSAKDVSTELRKVECPSSRAKSIQALKQIQRWLTAEQIEHSLVLEYFHCYGGIARLLDFMEENMDDWDCIVNVTAAIAEFLAFRWNDAEKSRKTARDLASMILRRKGIQLFLKANREHTIIHRISSDTKYIWLAIGRTVNGEETSGMIEEEQTTHILVDAVNCINHLEELRSCVDSSNAWTSDVLQAVLYTIANVIKNTPIGKEELKRTGILSVCLVVLNKNHDWTQNETVVTYALGILAICEKRRINIPKKDFDVFLPRLIYCLRTFGRNLQIISFTLILLESMCDKLQLEKIESSGVLEAISGLLKSQTLCGKTKDRVRGMMRKIIN